MPLTVNVKKDFSLREVINVIRSTLALDERIAKHKTGLCDNFETKHRMNSNIFLEKFDSG